MICPGTLHHGERLLVRTIRLLAAEVSCATRRSRFEHLCGAAGPEAYRMLEAFVCLLRARGRRRIVLSVPSDQRLTRDEGLILAAFAAAQIDDYRTLDTRLASLLGVEPPASVGAAVCLVAQHFAMNGLWLRPY